MAAQLEIIDPHGEISFYDLEMMHKIVNIGSDPENDIVLSGCNIPPFCVVLDCRQYPAQLIVLSEQGMPKLDGEVILPDVPVAVEHWGTIELDGYTLVLLQGDALGQVSVATNDRVSSATRASAAAVHVEPAAGSNENLIFDETDDLIVVEMATREWTVDVEHSVTTQITLINGGRVVADFDVQVHGLDPSWVEISSPRISLYEGGRATVAISISPPRKPSSRAGEYHFAIVVTSPNYPGHISRTVARLVVNPYYEFSVSELDPKQQSVSWSKQSAQTFFSLTNLGNSRTMFILEGKDDDRACLFEFQVPGQSALQTGKVGVQLAPDETLTLPIHVAPVERKLIGLGKRKFSYNITAWLHSADQMSCTVMGQLKSSPLLGPFHILAFLFCLCALIIFLFMPNPQPELRAAPAFLDEPGERVQLYYNASRFSGLKPGHLLNRLNSAFLKLRLEHKPDNSEEWQTLEAFKSQGAKSAGEVSLVPYSAVRYRLWARTWIPFIESWSEEVTVFVQPVQPVVTFTVQSNPIIAGQNAILQWQVRYAESLTLEYPGVQENLPADQLERGQISLPLDRTTTFTLIAANSSGSIPSKKSLTVQVLYPTPSIIQFNVSPNVVTLGESVNLVWDVSGADGVIIEPLGEVGTKGSTTDQPTGFSRYTLKAFHVGADGTRAESQPVVRDVQVHTPTPTPAPPVIDIFDAVPKQVVLGENQVVNLRWSVSGQTTNIEITAPNLKLSGLDPKDPDGLDITVDKTTLFILTAYNGERSVSTSIEVSAIEPTPTSTPTPTATPTATPTPTPEPPRIFTFIAKGDKVGTDVWRDTENGPLRVYPVEAGSPFKLEWKVSSTADQVILVGMGGPRSAEGSFEVSGLIENRTYQLTAEGQGGKVSAFVRMEVYLPPPPPAPSNLIGEVVLTGTTGITITWSYPSSPPKIVIGFRVYRADLPDQFKEVGFVHVQSSNLPTTMLPVSYQYFDPLNPGDICGKAYYVVVVYHDLIANQYRETDASLNSWYSKPCLP